MAWPAKAEHGGFLVLPVQWQILKQIPTHDNTRVFAQELSCADINEAQLLKQLMYQWTDRSAGQTCNFTVAAHRSDLTDVPDCVKLGRV